MCDKTIDDKIKSYEALMHRVLQDFNIKDNYEDLLQEMRIVVWKALTNTNPKTMYIENGNTKFTTYLYKIMSNRLINIFKIEYKMKANKNKTNEDGTARELPLIVRIKRNLARPKLLEDMTYKQQINAIQNMDDADSIRLKVDINTFYDTLSDFEKRVWALNLEGWTQEEITLKLREAGIHKVQTTVSRRLKILNDKFIKFIQEGEL